VSQPLDTGKPVDSGAVTPDHHDSGREAIAAQALDVIPSTVAVLDADGTIVTVNRAWRNFAHRHGAADADACEGSNFFEVCNAARGNAGTAARTVASALRQVLDGTLPAYEGELEWPAEVDSNWSGIQIFPLHSGGWTAEQAHGAAWWIDNIHPDDRPRVRAARPTSLEREHSIEEFRFRRADGTFFWVRDERRILSDADGCPSEGRHARDAWSRPGQRPPAAA
jgi:PAS domain-containing protein